MQGGGGVDCQGAWTSRRGGRGRVPLGRRLPDSPIGNPEPPQDAATGECMQGGGGVDCQGAWTSRRGGRGRVPRGRRSPDSPIGNPEPPQDAATGGCKQGGGAPNGLGAWASRRGGRGRVPLGRRLPDSPIGNPEPPQDAATGECMQGGGGLRELWPAGRLPNCGAARRAAFEAGGTGGALRRDGRTCRRAALAGRVDNPPQVDNLPHNGRLAGVIYSQGRNTKPE